jgi:hypothetical protein
MRRIGSRVLAPDLQGLEGAEDHAGEMGPEMTSGPDSGPSTDPSVRLRKRALTQEVPALAGTSRRALCRTRTGDPFLTIRYEGWDARSRAGTRAQEEYCSAAPLLKRGVCRGCPRLSAISARMYPFRTSHGTRATGARAI